MSYDRSGSARKVAHWARSTVIDREGYAELEVDATVELIRSVVPLGLLHIEELLDEEVTALAGERYAPARFSGAAVGSLRAALGGRRGRRRRRRHPRHRPPQQDEPGGRDQRCALPEERRGARRHRPGASRPRGSFSPCGGLSTSLGPGPGHAAGRHHVLLLRFSTRFLHREPPTRAANTRSAVTTSACSRSASARYRQS